MNRRVFLVCFRGLIAMKAVSVARTAWRMPLFPWIAIGAALVNATLIAVVVWDDPIAGFWSTVVAFAPLPIYLVFGKGWRRSAARAGGG